VPPTPTNSLLRSIRQVVKNIPQLLADKAEVDSPPFTCADDPVRTSFKMRLGFGTKEDGKLALHIRSISSDFQLFALSFKIWNKDMIRRTFEWIPIPSELCFVFKKYPHTYGYNFYSIKNDDEELRILLEVTYVTRIFAYLTAHSTTTTPNDSLSLPPNLIEFRNALLGLMGSTVESDVTVSVDNVWFRCHKVVLVARSPFFRALLQSGMEETVSNKITLTDISPELFRHVRRFLYSGQLPDDLAGIAFDLLPFTDKYVLDELKTACGDAIRPAVTVDNVIRAIVLADLHNCPDLFRHCLPIFKENIDALKQKEEWESIFVRDLMDRLLVSYCREDFANDTSRTNDSAECVPIGHAMQLCTDMGRMFGDKLVAEGGYADVLVELENGESVPVHRSFLFARSSYFRSLLAETGTVSKKIPVTGAPALVKEVIRFFYCGLPPENLESLAMDLLPVAMQFRAYELREMCDHALRRILTVENLVDILVLSEENSCPGLFAFCLPLCRASASRLTATCQEKLKANPGLLFKLALKGCAE